MPVSILYMHSVCGLNPRQLAPELKLGDTGARQPSHAFASWKATFQAPLIIYGSIFVVTWQKIPLPIRNAVLRLMAFQFLAYLLCCLLQDVHAPITEVSVWERLLDRIVPGNRYAPGSMSYLSVNIRMATLTTIR